jgi:hypothetical protein
MRRRGGSALSATAGEGGSAGEDTGSGSDAAALTGSPGPIIAECSLHNQEGTLRASAPWPFAMSVAEPPISVTRWDCQHDGRAGYFDLAHLRLVDVVLLGDRLQVSGIGSD